MFINYFFYFSASINSRRAAGCRRDCNHGDGERRRCGRLRGDVRREEHPRPLACSCDGVSGAGEGAVRAAAEAGELGRGASFVAHPRRALRRRLRVRQIPLRLQVGGRGDGAVRDTPAGAGPRVPAAEAEARVRGGAGAEGRRGERGRRAAARAAVRRAAAARPLHEAPRGRLPRRGEDRGLALPPGQRSAARARDPPVPPRDRPEGEAEREEQEGAERVSRAERGDGLLGAHLHRGLHGGRPQRRRKAVREQRPVPNVPHLPGTAAPHPPFRHLREEEDDAAGRGRRRRRLQAMQAHVAAAPPPRLHLRPPRPLPRSPLRPVEDEVAAGKERGR